jgi:hypothetical protein
VREETVIVIADTVATAIAGRGDEQDVLLRGADDRLLQRLRVPAAAPRVVQGDDVDPSVHLQVDEVIDRPDRGGSIAEPVRP